eukprot:1841967-Pyramimonas_sp.AAC.1
MSKGTGVVTSVPSDAPDDYMALMVSVDQSDEGRGYIPTERTNQTRGEGILFLHFTGPPVPI